MNWPAIVFTALAAAPLPGDIPQPRAGDERLELQLVAAEPDVVTPTGLTVDAQGRVLVIESHTHFRPENYQGPATDRIRMLQDFDFQGRARRITTFFEGTRYTMNLASYHDGSLYVATRAEIFRLYDTDGDGTADKRTVIARLDTAGDYPHNGLSGFAFDFAGNVYFGFGENLGASYRLIGADGTELSGGGEGGNVYRCAADGTGLVRMATGFWNPFHLCFDAFGRLFAVDNDPDSRPPCRLLHIVDQGDYGYRFRNGRKGLHPFTAWNGELPGTLPMVAGTGEAPSGVVAYESDNLPADYIGDLLVTSWGDHRIERYRLGERGASLLASMTPVVTGGENFRPVGIAVAPDGKVYFSDWVDRSYELHGKGRVWRLARRAAAPGNRPEDPVEALYSPHLPLREQAARRLLAQGPRGAGLLAEALASPDGRVRAVSYAALATADVQRQARARAMRAETSPDVLARFVAVEPQLDWTYVIAPRRPAAVRATALLRARGDDARQAALDVLDSNDPFLRHAGRVALSRCAAVDAAADPASFHTAGQRLAVALLLRHQYPQIAKGRVPELLRDPEPQVRFVGVQWIGEEGLSEFRTQLEETLATRATTRLLLEACLASLERLDGVSRAAKEEWSGQQYVLPVLLDEKAPADMRRRALRSLAPENAELSVDTLQSLLESSSAEMRLEAIRSLRDSSSPVQQAMLRSLAADRQRPVAERAEATVGLAADDAESRELLVELAYDAAGAVADEALRSLRGATLSPRQLARLQAELPHHSQPWQQAARMLLEPPAAANGSADPDVDGWLARLEGNGDPEIGQRIFHGRVTLCHRCHEIDGRGSSFGPNLSVIARSLTRQKLLESILVPSREVAPRYVPWLIETSDGRILTGLYLGQDNEGFQHYADNTGQPFRIKVDEIEQRKPHRESIMPNGLARTVTESELRDLLAYLMTCR